MIFTFGQYRDYEVDFVAKVDRKYCEWIAGKIKNKEKDKELYCAIIHKLSTIKVEPENPNVMMFGKYVGCNIEDFIFNDKSYCEWLLSEDSFKIEYPKTHKHLKKYYTIIYKESISKIAFLYILTFCDRSYLKVGITSNYIVKRIYSYTHTINFYTKDVIDYNKSFVYMTNDTEIEKKVLKHFRSQRVDKKTERIRISIDEIDNYIIHEQHNNHDFYYLKKCLNEFIPFDYGNLFKESFYIKINEFVKFKEVYERHLDRLNLLSKYNPFFNEINKLTT